MMRTEGVRARRRVRWGTAAIAAIAILACASVAYAKGAVQAPASARAKPTTIHAAAYAHMKTFMTRYDKDGFAKVVDFGALKAYRVKLAAVKIKLRGGQEALAKYDPKTKTITLSLDPRVVTEAESVAYGETVWHEVTHALEDQHGDIGIFDTKAYAERNVDYMTHIARVATPFLDEMERKAKAGASVDKLREYWDDYLAAVEAAGKLESTTKYPPDLALMRSWFGFRANPVDVKALYLSGKGLPGKAGQLLKQAVTDRFKASDWAGVWQGYNMPWGKLTLTVSGNSVTGVWEYPAYAQDFTGTISADATTLTGTWHRPSDLVDGPPYTVMSYVVTLGVYSATGVYYFDGYYIDERNSSRFPFGGSRE